MKLTQNAVVRNRLTRYGSVSNRWAIGHGIWRLAARIADLRAEGLAIETEYDTERVGRNCHYRLAAGPDLGEAIGKVYAAANQTT